MRNWRKRREEEGRVAALNERVIEERVMLNEAALAEMEG
jgi:hypothetical protein